MQVIFTKASIKTVWKALLQKFYPETRARHQPRWSQENDTRFEFSQDNRVIEQWRSGVTSIE